MPTKSLLRSFTQPELLNSVGQGFGQILSKLNNFRQAIKDNLVFCELSSSSFFRLSESWIPSNNFELEGFIAIENASTNFFLIFGQHNNNRIYLGVTSGSLLLGNGAVGTTVPNAFVADGRLYHVKLRVENSEVTVYLNNDLVFTQPQAFTGTPSLNSIGAKLDTIAGVSTNHFKGVISRVKFTDLSVPSNSLAFSLDSLFDFEASYLNSLPTTNLLINGDFTNGTNNWIPSAAILTEENNKLLVADAGGFSCAYQAVPTVIGQSYLIAVLRDSVIGDTFSALGWGSTVPVAGVDLGEFNINLPIGDLIYSFIYVATSTTTYIALGSNGTSTALYNSVEIYPISKYLTYVIPNSIGRAPYALVNDRYISNDLILQPVSLENFTFSANATLITPNSFSSNTADASGCSINFNGNMPFSLLKKVLLEYSITTTNSSLEIRNSFNDSAGTLITTIPADTSITDFLEYDLTTNSIYLRSTGSSTNQVINSLRLRLTIPLSF